MGKTMTVRPPAELKVKLHDKAERMGITVNALVLQIIWQYFDEEEDKDNEKRETLLDIMSRR